MVRAAGHPGRDRTSGHGVGRPVPVVGHEVPPWEAPGQPIWASQSWNRNIPETGWPQSLRRHGFRRVQYRRTVFLAIPRSSAIPRMERPLSSRRSLSLVPPSAKCVEHLHEVFVNDALVPRWVNSIAAISLIFTSALTPGMGSCPCGGPREPSVTAPKNQGSLAPTGTNRPRLRSLSLPEQPAWGPGGLIIDSTELGNVLSQFSQPRGRLQRRSCGRLCCYDFRWLDLPGGWQDRGGEQGTGDALFIRHQIEWAHTYPLSRLEKCRLIFASHTPCCRWIQA